MTGVTDANKGEHYELFKRALQQYSLQDLAEELSLHSGTLKRWQYIQAVPSSYRSDFLRILGIEAIGGGPREKDQFYTKPNIACMCWDRLRDASKYLGISLSHYHFIEPSAGCGAFYDCLPPDRRLGLDIEPNGYGINKQDYLKWSPSMNKKYIVIGNPPFGLRGNLALKFINHSYKFADVVAFILPQLFESDGKGSAMKRVLGYKLAHSEKLPSNSFYYPNKKDVDINTIFQVWTKVNTHKVNSPPKITCDEYIKVYSLSDGGTPSSTRNKNMLNKCDVYLPSTTFQGMKAFTSFEELPHRRGYGVFIHNKKRDIKKILFEHDWSKTAFASTNSALNLRTSLIQQVIVAAGFIDEKLL